MGKYFSDEHAGHWRIYRLWHLLRLHLIELSILSREGAAVYQLLTPRVKRLPLFLDPRLHPRNPLVFNEGCEIPNLEITVLISYVQVSPIHLVKYFFVVVSAYRLSLSHKECRFLIFEKFLVLICGNQFFNFVFKGVIYVDVGFLREHLIVISIEIFFEWKSKVVLEFSESNGW